MFIVLIEGVSTVTELVDLVKKEILRTGLWVAVAIAVAVAVTYFWK